MNERQRPTGSVVDTRRRTLMKGAAWSVPVVAAATVVPFAAASVACPAGCPTLGFGSGVGANGWTQGSSGAYDGAPFVYSSSYQPYSGANSCNSVTGGSGGGTLLNAIVAEGDPTSATPAQQIMTYSRTVCLVRNITYTFGYSFANYQANQRTLTLQASILSGTTVVANIGNAVVATAQTSNASGTRSGSYTPTVTANYTFMYTFTPSSAPANNSTCNRYTNDIGISAPTLTCSPTPK